MQNIKHIHEVVFLVEANNGQWTPDEMVTAIGQTWGEDIQFAACSGQAFSKEYALGFLLNRNKIVITDDGKIKLHPSMTLCNGHEEFNG